MIKIDLAYGLAVYLSTALVLVIAGWIFYNYTRDNDTVHETKYLKQCPYCTHIFFDYKGETDVLTCPRCQSYLTKNREEGHLSG